MVQRIVKNVQGIIQSLVQDSAYYSKMSRVLFSIWFRIQLIIKKCRVCYSESGSRFRVLLKNVQGIIQPLVQDSAYYSKYDQQRPVQDLAYY